jgi:DNA-binding NarL/FixJ family response regulator
MSSRTAVLLDSQPLTLTALEQILQTLEMEVVAKVATTTAALTAVTAHGPDLLMADIDSRDANLDVFSCIRAARTHDPNLRVLVLAAHADAHDIQQAFAAGADGYVVKTAQPADIASAVRQAFEHSIFFPEAVMPRRHHLGAGGSGSYETDVLTRRELEILRLVADGHSNGELARMLWVTEQTVKFHLSNIYRKLNVANRTEASRWAHVHGLLAGDDAGPGATVTSIAG